MAKIKKSSTPKVKQEKLEPIVVVDTYRELMGYKNKNATNHYIDQLCDAFMKWAIRDDSLHLTQFSTEIGITRESLDGMINRHEKVKEAKNAALRIISARREVGAISGKLNASAVIAFQGMHDQEFREWLRVKAEFANPQFAQANTQYIIHMPNLGTDNEHNDGNTPK